MGSFVRHHPVTMTSKQYIPQRQSMLHVLPLLFSYVLHMYDISARHTGYHTNCTYLIKSEVFEHAPTYTFVHTWFKDFCRTRVKLLNILSSLEHISTYNRHKRVSCIRILRNTNLTWQSQANGGWEPATTMIVFLVSFVTIILTQ